MFRFLFISILIAFSSAVAENATVGPKGAVLLIIRHAEKLDTGTGLSPAGQQRAQAYARYFKDLSVDGKPMSPQAVYAAKDSQQSQRPRLTVEPFAHAAGLSINL